MGLRRPSSATWHTGQPANLDEALNQGPNSDQDYRCLQGLTDLGLITTARAPADCVRLILFRDGRAGLWQVRALYRTLAAQTKKGWSVQMRKASSRHLSSEEFERMPLCEKALQQIGACL
jgi:hypothetical protein